MDRAPRERRGPPRMRSIHVIVGLVAEMLVVGLASMQSAQALGSGSGSVSLTTSGSAYTQDFNTLATTGTTNNLAINGWYLAEAGAGANNNGQYAAGTGSGNGGDTYGYGASASTERALGGLLSGSLNPTVGAQFTNNTGSTLVSLDISYVGEMWRAGVTNRSAADRLDFQLSTTATGLTTGTWVDYDSLDFNSPNIFATAGALDGNSTLNRTPLSFSITGLSIPNGASFWIRWMDLDTTGADDGLAMDSFSLTPHEFVPPPPICTITGTAGAETLTGTAGDDVICGLGGNDILKGLGGNDTLQGADGNDTIRPGAGNDSVDGGAGTDTVSYFNDATVVGGVTVNLATVGAQNTVGAGTDTITTTENAVGTNLVDTLTGTTGANTLYGKNGNDSLAGDEGNDILLPGTGNDAVNGGVGLDTVNYSDLTAGVTVSLSAPSTGGAAGTDALSLVERATGTNFVDTLTGNALVNILNGLGGNDSIFGLDANDTLDGGTGTDSLDGGNGTDTCKNGEANINCEP